MGLSNKIKNIALAYVQYVHWNLQIIYSAFSTQYCYYSYKLAVIKSNIIICIPTSDNLT